MRGVFTIAPKINRTNKEHANYHYNNSKSIHTKTMFIN